MIASSVFGPYPSRCSSQNTDLRRRTWRSLSTDCAAAEGARVAPTHKWASLVPGPAVSVLKAVTIIRPETLVRWHRAGFRRYWRWKSHSLGGRPKIAADLRALIRRMSAENPLWERRASMANYSRSASVAHRASRPLSLLLWTLLSCSFFLKISVARAFSRRTVTTARNPALIVPSVDGFRVILWFACAVRHVENIIPVSLRATPAL